MVHVVTATFHARPGEEARVAQHLGALAAASRSEPGCLAYVAHKATDDAATFLVYERYRDRAAFEAHRASEHFQRHAIDGVLGLCDDRSAATYTPLAEPEGEPGRAALVFGGASGISRATALLLAERGCAVAVADLDADGAAEVAAEARAIGQDALAVRTDVGDPADVAAAVAAAVERFGRLDVLVTGAGHLHLARFSELTPDVVHRMVAVHLEGTLFAVQAAAAAMRGQRWGRVVCIASAAAVKGSPDHHHYAAAKAGIVGLVRSLAAELARDGVTINAVLPGAIDTPMLAGLDVTQRQRLVAATPAGRLGTPEDVAHTIAFLASEDAGFITGTALLVAGGATL